VTGVLPAAQRLRRHQDFDDVVRRGRRVSAAGMTTHWVPGESGAVRVGFVVSRAVGPAVVRNRVRRRLRHLMAARTAALPAGTTLVIRTTPRCALAPFDALASGLDVMVDRVRADSGAA
jgi:ribonuclease P protein component